MDNVRKNEIIAVVLFAISLFLFLSIFTFSDQDLSFYTSSPNISPQNMTGVVGSYIGAVLLFIFGKASYVVPLLVLIWGLSRLLQMEANKIFFKVFGTIFLLIAVSSSLSILQDPARTTSFTKGGLVGTVVSGFLLRYLGKAGASVFIIALMVLSILVATEFLILPMLIEVFKFAKRAISKIKMPAPQRYERKISRASSMKEGFRSAKESIAKKIESVKEATLKVKKPLPKREEAPRPERDLFGSRQSKPEPKIVRARETEKVSVKPVRVTPVSDGETGEKVEYKLPGLDLLIAPSTGGQKEREEDLKSRASLLENTLMDFGVEAKVVKINQGPVITMYELEPSVGTKVNRITSLSDNISLALKSANIRIVAPLPGKGTIGIEVPNEKSEQVFLRDVLESSGFADDDGALKLALGKDISGETIVVDLAKMPHLLIAGATGSGKTVCINTVITSLLANFSPEELKFIMVDPKRVELMMFEDIPHLALPIITSAKKVSAALGWAISEMERRYDIFAEKGVRNLASYKERSKEDWENLPYIIVIIDELADLITVAQQDVESAIQRLAQLSRAAGIHMILATQRPSVNVITGVIKANFPARISFKVASKVDSRTVLDANGAEKLLGRGDMLVMEPGESSLRRGQCSLVQDSEIRNVVKFIKEQTGTQYIEAAVQKQEKKASGVEQEKDDLYLQAVEMVLATRQASVSMIQRKFRVGYTRAARMIDIMEEEGVVGPYNGAKPRDILIDAVEETEEA